MTANLEVPGDVTVTIDLNGHTITGSGNHAIENHGNLTVQGEGKIVSKMAVRLRSTMHRRNSSAERRYL